MDRKNENQFQLKKTASDMVKSLLIAYVVTGIFLLILTLLLYKMGLSEQKVNIGVILIYVIATFSGGFVMGKLSMTHKFLWGLLTGVLYWGLLMLISLESIIHCRLKGKPSYNTSFMCRWRNAGRNGFLIG